MHGARRTSNTRALHPVRIARPVSARLLRAPLTRPPAPSASRPFGLVALHFGRLPLAGTGKSHLLVALLERLQTEQPRLHIAVHHAASGHGGADFARVALSRLCMALLQLRAAEAKSDRRARAALATTLGYGLLDASAVPSSYVALCARCRELLGGVTSPLLIAWDGLERLQPPLEAGSPVAAGSAATSFRDGAALDWLPSPLPPNVCVLFVASGEPSKPTAPEAALAAKEAHDVLKTSMSGQIARLHREAQTAEAAATEAAATARAAPLVEELRLLKPKPQQLLFSPLPVDAARQMMRASLHRLTGHDAAAGHLQPALSNGRASQRPSWLSALSISCGRAALSERLNALLRPLPHESLRSERRTSSLSPADNKPASAALFPPAASHAHTHAPPHAQQPTGYAPFGLPGYGERPKPSGGAHGGGNHGGGAHAGAAPAPGLAALALRLKDGGLLRSDEAELCRQAVLSMQSQLQRVSLHRGPPGAAGSVSSMDEGGGAAHGRMPLGGPRRTPVEYGLPPPDTAGSGDELGVDGMSALECEVAGMRAALRVLALVCLSGHGFGLSEAHAYALLKPELPARAAGAIWALACEHLALFLGPPAAGVWLLPHQSLGHGLRAALLSNGTGEAYHQELSQYYLSCLDPKYDGSFSGGWGAARAGLSAVVGLSAVGGACSKIIAAHDTAASVGAAAAADEPLGAEVGADEPVVLLAAPWHLWHAGVAQRPTLIGLLRSTGYAARLAGVAHVPPLPLLLLECLCRGHTGAREPEATAQLWEESEEAVAVAAITAPAERDAAVHKLLRRVAKRLEVRSEARPPLPALAI